MNQNWLNRSGGPARTRSVLGCGLLAAALVNPATAQTDGARSGEDLVLEQFTVTGSRIKRIDTETPQPVVRITTADFEATGFTTLGDAIRAMPMISGQSLVSVDAGTSFTPGVSSFNLRGLGNNNTLVLVNGRRAAPFASAGFNGFQTVFDFNSIPTAAIESLEVLKDGACGSKTMVDKGPKMIDADYSKQGQIKTSLKDNRLMLEMGQSVGAPMLMTALLSQLLQAAYEKGYAEKDTVAYYEILRGMAGLEERAGIDDVPMGKSK